MLEDVTDETVHHEGDGFLELFDRGEPVVSVAGLAITTELLLAFRGGTAT